MTQLTRLGYRRQGSQLTVGNCTLMLIGATRRYRQAGPDLVSQGLRTLELCIDNLTPVFLDPIMAPVIGDLMQALWKVRHLELCV